MHARHLGLVLAVGLSLVSSSVLANGRYPNADMLIVDPGDPNHLVLRATFGTLVSRDGGQRWSWICEESIGYTGDPALTILAGGRTLHAFLGSIQVSSDDACSYELVPFDAQGRFAVDVTLDAADVSHAWVLTSGFMGRRQASVLDVSVAGATLTVASEDFVPSTLEVARSRPQRIYIMGFDADFRSTLLVSDDRGASWTARPVPLYSALPMYLSAIAPGDPDTLYVRVDDGSSDHLLISRDGGQSFTDVLTIGTDMLGFALSPDGSRVAAGGPGDGLYVANTSDMSFSRAAELQSIRCLTWTARGLFACAQESLEQWTLALSSDDGQSFAPLWHVQDLVPLECSPGSDVESTCSRFWLDISSQIGADLVPGQPEPAPANPSKSSSCELRARAPSRAGWPAPAPALALAAVLLLRRRSAARQRARSL
jgi:photosystem II stability/assembly factor-like uncharacterized protein